jgi:hypothetical protein
MAGDAGMSDKKSMDERMSVIGDVVRIADILLSLRDEELVAGIELATVATGMEAATALRDGHAALACLLALVERARDRVLAAGAQRDSTTKPN